MKDKNCVVKIDQVSFGYDKRNVLENINLCIPSGAFLAIVGPNGSGKSTLIKLILGLLKPTHGQIYLFDESVSKFSKWESIGYVSQKSNSFNTGFPATVKEVVSSGLTSKKGYFRFFKKEDKNKVREAIETVGLLDYIESNLGELSGGQQQRVFIARALVSEPKLLILDEPTVGVDQANVEQFYELLGKLTEEGITLVLITHDIGAVSDKVTHVACLNRKLYFHGNVTDYNNLSNEQLSDMYGHPLQVVEHNHSHGGTE